MNLQTMSDNLFDFLARGGLTYVTDCLHLVLVIKVLGTRPPFGQLLLGE